MRWSVHGASGVIPALGEVVTDRRLYRQETVTDWAEGSTLLVSAECWQRCGPWDESFFLYSEETDFALRARDLGFVTRYLPSAHAVHLEGDSAQSPALWTLVMLNRVRLFRRRNGIIRTAAYWGALVSREASRAVLGKATSRAAVKALISPRRLREPRGPHSIRRAAADGYRNRFTRLTAACRVRRAKLGRLSRAARNDSGVSSRRTLNRGCSQLSGRAARRSLV